MDALREIECVNISCDSQRPDRAGRLQLLALCVKSEPELDRALVLFRGARSIRRNTGIRVARLHEVVLSQILFDFLAADIGAAFLR